MADPVGSNVGIEYGLANWAAPYVSSYLEKGAALGNEDYQSYQGPLTAGPSTLQNQAFGMASGIAGQPAPTSANYNMDFTNFQPGTFTNQGTATQYMNPYLDAALAPQLNEIRRQTDITRMGDRARFANAGAYGGSRQAIMESELNRNMGQNLADVTGKGYFDAFNTGREQFNTEQNRSQSALDNANRLKLDANTARMDFDKFGRQYGLESLNTVANLGGVQRGIASEGMAADQAQFAEERKHPYEQVNFMKSLIDGLPTSSAGYTMAAPSAWSNIQGTAGSIISLIEQLYGKKS